VIKPGKLAVDQKVLFTFSALCGILLTLGGLILFSLQSLERSNKRQLRATEELALIDAAAQGVGQMEAVVLQEVLASDTAEITRLDQTVRRIETINARDLGSYQKFLDTEKERQLYDRVMRTRMAYWQQTLPVLALSRANRDAEAIGLINSAQAPAYDAFLKAVNALIKYVETDAADTARATSRFLSAIKIIGNVLVAVTILVAVGTGFAAAGVVHKLKDDKRLLQNEVTERKQTEKALRESEQRFRRLAEATSEVFWILDPLKHEVVYVSPAYEKVWGRTCQSLYEDALSFLDAVHIDDQLKVRANLERLAQGEATDQEYQIVRPDGSIRWICDRGYPIRNEAGAIYLVTGIAQDITERKRAEESLRLLASALEQSRESIVITDAQLDLPGPGILFVNPAFTQMTGYTQEEVIGKSPRILQGPRTDKAVLKRLRENLARGEPFAGEAINYRKNGTEFDLEWQIAPIRNGSGIITHFVGTQRDITGRKHAEAARDRLVAIIESTSDMVSIADRAGHLVYLNRAGRNLLGVDLLEDITKCAISDFLPNHTEDPQLTEAIPAAARDGTWSGESILLSRGGQEISVSQVILSHLSPDGQIEFLSTIMRDITERKRSEKELEVVHQELLETSRLAGRAEVATNVLHNVGNVLNSVNISAALVRDRVKKSRTSSLAKIAALFREHEEDLGTFLTTDPQGRRLPAYLSQLSGHLLADQKTTIQELESLEGNIEHIKAIVAMQQSYAAVGGVKETIDLVQLVDDSLRLIESAFSRHGVEVIREFAPVPSINAEKHKVLQILVNLLRNAKHACQDSDREEKRIAVRVVNGAGRVKISVTDNGVGIPAENLTRIFNHGFTTRKDGHGFGLHSGALAAKEMGGSLTMRSDGPDQGATCTLELPCSASEEPHS